MLGWDGIKKQIAIVGIIVIVLSFIIASQYSTINTGYSYSIVHPSNADIRYIGSDNTSNNIRILQVNGDNSSSSKNVKLEFGNWTVEQNTTYTAAFAIVNEERFDVNITHINVSTSSGNDFLQIWLHGDRDQKIEDDDSSVFMWDNGSSMNDVDTVAWTLNAGNGNPNDMNGANTSILTDWDETAHVRYSNNNTNAVSGQSDYVWVQISINVPIGADPQESYSGMIWINFESGTHWAMPAFLNFGSSALFDSASYLSTTSLDSSHFVTTYSTGADGKAVVGTISDGNVISYGSSVIFGSGGGGVRCTSVTALDSMNVVISYFNRTTALGPYYGMAVVGIISGNSINFGTPEIFHSNDGVFWDYNSIVSLDSTHVVITFRNLSNSYGTSLVGTISGDSISFGNEFVFNAGSTSQISTTALDSTHIAISYEDNGNSNYGTTIIGTISGESINFGSEEVFETKTSTYTSITSLDRTHVVIGYQDQSSPPPPYSYNGYAIIGTVSGDSISFEGSSNVFNSGQSNYISTTALDSTHVIIAYSDVETTGTGRAIVGTVSGNSINFGNEVIFEPTIATQYISTSILDGTHLVIVYENGLNGYGYAIVGIYK